MTLLHAGAGFGSVAGRSLHPACTITGMYTDSEDADMRSHLTFSQQEVPSLKPRRGRADRTNTGVPARRGVARPAGEDWNNGLGTEWKERIIQGGGSRMKAI